MKLWEVLESVCLSRYHSLRSQRCKWRHANVSFVTKTSHTGTMTQVWTYNWNLFNQNPLHSHTCSSVECKSHVSLRFRMDFTDNKTIFGDILKVCQDLMKIHFDSSLQQLHNLVTMLLFLTDFAINSRSERILKNTIINSDISTYFAFSKYVTNWDFGSCRIPYWAFHRQGKCI